MKFTLQREQLVKATAIGYGCGGTPSNIPVLSNLLVQAGENGISLTGTDLEVELTVVIKDCCCCSW